MIEQVGEHLDIPGTVSTPSNMVRSPQSQWLSGIYNQSRVVHVMKWQGVLIGNPIIGWQCIDLLSSFGYVPAHVDMC